MELTSKQRAQLRGLANSIDTILIVGKNGIGDDLVTQANEALEARELIKGKVLENSLLSPREAAEALAPLTRSEVVQVIGTKFVLYRPSHKKDKKDKIVLVQEKKRPKG
ncbi:YhbY family RNA-binding protein [bacterium 1xD42-67]|nr:YhbY family RNA-binding protein [bacterium 1xD42-67]